MTQSRIKELLNEFIGRLGKRKLLLVATALLGFPTLSFSSYLTFSRIPFSFVDASTIANFFMSFYLSLVFSIAIARVITFFIEVSYRIYLIKHVLPKKRKTSNVTKKMMAWGERASQSNSLSVQEFGMMTKSLYRYERYRLRGKFLVDKNAKRIFQELNSYYFVAPIAFYSVCFMFSGVYLSTFIAFLYICLPFIGRLSLSNAERELKGIVIASLGRAAHDKLKSDNQLDIIPLTTHENIEKIFSNNPKGFFEHVRHHYMEFKDHTLNNISTISTMLKNDYGVLVFCILILGIFSGASKYRSDYIFEIKMTTDMGLLDCVSPLLNTANHMILYSHGEEEIIAVPYEQARYYRSIDCPLDN